MAANLKLDTLSMGDLEEVIAEASKLLEAKRDARRKELMAELETLGGIPAKAPASSRQRAAPQPKYRSKKNPDLTWAGRGGTPRWLVAEMEETGSTVEAYLIK